MNRDEILEMARQSGWTGLYIQWAEPSGKPDWSPYKETLTVPVTIEQVERFAALVAERTREECAGICDRFHDRMMVPAECAAAIRSMKAY